MIVDKLAEVFTQTLDTDLTPEQFPRENIIELFQLNSVDALQILINVENEFNIEIDDDDLNSELINSLYVLEKYVQGKLGQNG
ncbi:MAG TPA: hypothetical protein VHP38_02570 [Ruminiclostridium sp.]|nr:hypothetical protein [Ruminiclostridium sp.]